MSFIETENKILHQQTERIKDGDVSYFLFVSALSLKVEIF